MHYWKKKEDTVIKRFLRWREQRRRIRFRERHFAPIEYDDRKERRRRLRRLLVSSVQYDRPK